MARRITIKDVAAKAGVSYQTVSKVLNGGLRVLPETESRIWDAARELGYKPHSTARNLRTQCSHMIGYSWVPIKPTEDNHILDLFLNSVVAEAKAAGYYLLPFPAHEDEAATPPRENDDHQSASSPAAEAQVEVYRELIDTGRVDGFLLSSIGYHDARIDFLVERQFPFVAFGHTHPAASFPYVDVDNVAGVQRAVEHLLAKGHRRIAILALEEEARVCEERLEGYHAAMHAAGLRVEPDWVARGRADFGFGHAATARWLSGEASERPTAIVSVSDTLAIGAVFAAQEQGLTVGRDLAIVGYDDIQTAQYLRPALTTVRQPIQQVGRKCVEILAALIEGRAPAERQVVLQPELIVRESA